MGLLEGRGLLVTGGTRGIGRAVVLAAVVEGANVVFCGRRRPHPDERFGWAAVGGRAHFVPADVSREDHVDRLFDAAAQRLLRLHAVVSCAGVDCNRLLVDTTLEEWNWVLSVNLRGAFLVARRAVEEFLAMGSGRLVNVASFAANGLVGQGAYAASKAGLLALSRCIAKEYGRKGISCNAVVPGFVDTDMTASLSPTARRLRERITPHGRFATPEEVAQAILFLCSDEASHVTGDELYVAGAVRDVPVLDSKEIERWPYPSA
jgi:3-oxoacyl-[acyl-carrier protein] reductase